jgi:hypothetical protein
MHNYYSYSAIPGTSKHIKFRLHACRRRNQNLSQEKKITSDFKLKKFLNNKRDIKQLTYSFILNSIPDSLKKRSIYIGKNHM